MTLMWAVLVVVLLGVAAAVAAGRGGGLGRAHADRPDVRLPVGRPLSADDLEDVEFSLAVRGYRMDEVDDLLRRLRTEVAERDALIVELERPRHRAASDPPLDVEPPDVEPRVTDMPTASQPAVTASPSHAPPGAGPRSGARTPQPEPQPGPQPGPQSEPQPEPAASPHHRRD